MCLFACLSLCLSVCLSALVFACLCLFNSVSCLGFLHLCQVVVFCHTCDVYTSTKAVRKATVILRKMGPHPVVTMDDWDDLILVNTNAGMRNSSIFMKLTQLGLCNQCE